MKNNIFCISFRRERVINNQTKNVVRYSGSDSVGAAAGLPRAVSYRQTIKNEKSTEKQFWHEITPTFQTSVFAVETSTKRHWTGMHQSVKKIKQRNHQNSAQWPENLNKKSRKSRPSNRTQPLEAFQAKKQTFK